MLIEQELGTLIRRLNPYTDGKSKSMMLTGDSPNLNTLAAVLKDGVKGDKTKNKDALTAAATAVDDALDLTHLDLEVDDNYAQTGTQWLFRGQPQNIKKVLRLKYRYPVRDKNDSNKILCWVSDYLLIGYSGSGGGQ